MALEIPNKESEKTQSSANVSNVFDNSDDDLNKPYVDKRSVTISLAKNYSNYRKVNMKTLGPKKETIGSSIRSCQVLSSNAQEVNTYFPSLIGVSANDPSFISRVKSWLSNIQVVVNDSDVKLNTSFFYNTKADYIKIKVKEDKINEDYERVDRANTSAIKEALKVKIDALNSLESTKYAYGHPENLEEYLIYRHCLLYKDVAKDMALINSDASLRFYIKDEAKEAERQKKLTEEKVKAMKAFVELNGTGSKFDAAYVAICLSRNDNIAEALLKDRNQKSAIVMEFVNSNPDKFNRIVNDKHLNIKAFIETLIARGELVRSDYNQQISTADGTFIGANVTEAIAWFENPNNASVKAAYENKIKMF